ncbi:MAG TPA: fibronectin type III domain-containing protein [Armatimonadota bacterium]|nr:fibronectin type III domain-containing protein [Armatimonadota bacterium]
MTETQKTAGAVGLGLASLVAAVTLSSFSPVGEPTGTTAGTTAGMAPGEAWKAGYTRLNATPLTVPRYTDPTVQPGSTYTYRVTAVDQAGNESAPSDPVTVTVPPPGSPILDERGLPLAGIKLLATSPGKRSFVTYSCAYGHWLLPILVAGKWTIVPARSGYRFVPSSVTLDVPEPRMFSGSDVAFQAVPLSAPKPSAAPAALKS